MIGGCSVFLDGVNDYVNLGTVAARNFTTSPFTLLAWIYPTSISAVHRVIQHGTSGVNGYSLRVNAAGALIGATSSPGEATSQTANGAIQAGKWQHVAMVRDGASVRLFIDGDDATAFFAGHSNPASSAGNTVVGATVAGTADRFAGAIDEPAFFNRALTQQEIRRLRWMSIPASTSGLVSLHHFDDGLANFATTNATPAVGLAGTLFNGASWVYDRWAPWVEPRVAASAALTINTDVKAGMAGTLRRFIPRVASRLKISAMFDVSLTTAGTGFMLGEISVNGSPLSGQAVFGAPAGTPLVRFPIPLIQTVDLQKDGLYTIELTGRLNAALNTIRGTFNQLHSGYAMVAEPIDGTW